MYRYSDATQVREHGADMAYMFSGAPEDSDYSLHPSGCRHQACSLPISQCSETWSTRLAGGMRSIERRIEAIEESVDQLSLELRIDMPGMHLGQHSLVLPCEICLRHSVVSWEWYSKVLGHCCKSTGVCLGFCDFQTPAEYYLFIANTYHLLQTPQFGQLNDSSATKGGG